MCRYLSVFSAADLANKLHLLIDWSIGTVITAKPWSRDCAVQCAGGR